MSKMQKGLWKGLSHLIGLAAQRANFECGGGGVGAGQVVPGVLRVGCPGHKEVVAGGPEHDVVGLVMLQSLQQHMQLSCRETSLAHTSRQRSSGIYSAEQQTICSISNMLHIYIYIYIQMHTHEALALVIYVLSRQGIEMPQDQEALQQVLRVTC